MVAQRLNHISILVEDSIQIVDEMFQRMRGQWIPMRGCLRLIQAVGIVLHNQQVCMGALQTIFQFMCSQKRFSQASLLVSTKYFQYELRFFLLRSSGLQMQPFTCWHSGQHISTWNYEITVEQMIYISRLQVYRWPLELVISFSNLYIWDLRLRFG